MCASNIFPIVILICLWSANLKQKNPDGQTMLASTLIPQPHSMLNAPFEEDVNMSFGRLYLFLYLYWIIPLMRIKYLKVMFLQYAIARFDIEWKWWWSWGNVVHFISILNFYWVLCYQKSFLRIISHWAGCGIFQVWLISFMIFL